MKLHAWGISLWVSIRHQDPVLVVIGGSWCIKSIKLGRWPWLDLCGMLPLGLGPVIVSMLVNYYPAIFMQTATITFVLLSVWAQFKNHLLSLASGFRWFFGGWFHLFRRVLEMCCFMEKMLANMLADFEMKVEKAVLEPLNKLSEVRMTQSTFWQRSSGIRYFIFCIRRIYQRSSEIRSSLLSSQWIGTMQK